MVRVSQQEVNRRVYCVTSPREITPAHHGSHNELGPFAEGQFPRGSLFSSVAIQVGHHLLQLSHSRLQFLNLLVLLLQLLSPCD